MSHYNRRRYWGAWHVSKRRQLTNLFGGIDHDIERAFFALPSHARKALFIDYGRQYGKSAAAYARRTYPRWKRGAVKLSGQTAERLLELLPPRLTTEQRYELIRKLRAHYLVRTEEYITTPPETWRQRVIPAVTKVIRASRDFELPQELYKKAAWLADGDTQAVHDILHSIDEEEARLRTAYLDAEFKRIEIFLANVNNTESASHTISIPQGDIYVTIQKETPALLQSLFGNGRTTMSGDSSELVPREELQKDLVVQQSRGHFLDVTLDDLDESQQSDLRKKILEVQIGLDESQAKADQRFHDSTRDMANTVQAVRSLEESRTYPRTCLSSSIVHPR